jgi:hypothetical protein
VITADATVNLLLVVGSARSPEHRRWPRARWRLGGRRRTAIALPTTSFESSAEHERVRGPDADDRTDEEKGEGGSRG